MVEGHIELAWGMETWRLTFLCQMGAELKGLVGLSFIIENPLELGCGPSQLC